MAGVREQVVNNPERTPGNPSAWRRTGLWFKSGRNWLRIVLPLVVVAGLFAAARGTH